MNAAERYDSAYAALGVAKAFADIALRRLPEGADATLRAMVADARQELETAIDALEAPCR